MPVGRGVATDVASPVVVLRRAAVRLVVIAFGGGSEARRNGETRGVHCAAVLEVEEEAVGVRAVAVAVGVAVAVKEMVGLGFVPASSLGWTCR
ncbi:hypothetical protein GCM10017771_79960 [Streptomyces capitiformicae]|uniref:Uncharacterized protein n=1 Tax=Streptomyces capitiformicae TaxID=2014920 RepID=A0A919DME2_9ACTN|nr:hypothetical protein GCM10017771_79960 [Streptomyces capitiformicae]